MIRALTLIAALVVAPVAQAQEAVQTPPVFAPIEAPGADLAALRNVARPIVVFADTPDDPAFAEQMRLLSARWAELAERGVVVITDTDPAAESAVRRALRPRGFSLVVIDRDGLVALRKPFPWDAREIMRAIDRMPDRREEMRNERAEQG